MNQQCRCTEFNTRDRGPARRAGEAYLHDFYDMSGFETHSGAAGPRLGVSPLGILSLTARSRAAWQCLFTAGLGRACDSVRPVTGCPRWGFPSLTARSRTARAAAVIRDAAA